MRYLRFIVTPAVLSLVFAYLLPSAGITLAAGATGLLAAVALGVTYCALFSGYRHVEHWFVGRFAKDHVQAYSLCQLSAIFAMVLAGVALFGIEWLFPLYLQIAGWAPAALAGFWLAVIGLSLTPSPALVRSFRQSDAGADKAPKQPEPQPAPPSSEQSGPAAGDHDGAGK